MAEPANRKTNTAGGKYYIHPQTEEQFTSVTTALDVIGKAALKIWAGMVAADMAFDLIPQMTTSLLEPPCGNTFNRCYQKHGASARCERCPCGTCERCIWRRIAWRHAAESSRRAQEGTELHEAVQFWVTSGGKENSLRKEVLPYWQAFLSFVRDYGLAPSDWLATEITMLNREHMYAGTSDAVIVIRRERSAKAAEICDLFGPECMVVVVRVDWKTREKGDERLYDDMPLQAVGYNRCEVGMLPNGDEYALPHVDLSAILQLRPGDYSFKPVVTDDVTFAAFLQALGVYRWIEGPGKVAFDLEAVAAAIEIQQAAQERAAVATIRDVLGGQPIDADGNTVVELPAGPVTIPNVPYDAPNWPGGSTQPPTDDLPAFDDPWGETVQPDPWPTEPAPPPAPGSLADLKAHGEATKPPAKKTAPRKSAAAKKASATQKADPFDLAQTGSATLASLKDFDPGKPDPSALGDDIPF